MAGNVKMNLTLPEAEGNYANLFKAVRFGEDAKEQYGVILVWKKTKANEAALKPLRDAVVAVAKDAFGKKAEKMPSPLKDGDAEGVPDSLTETVKGCWFMRVASTRKPAVVDRQVQEVLDPSEAYSGCIFKANVTVYPWTFGVKTGVSAGLNSVQVVKKGERKGGGPAPSKAFTPLPEEGEEAGEDLAG
jgi:hypothetical protein